MEAERRQVEKTLSSLIARRIAAESSRLADSLLGEMATVATLLTNPKRQAPFAVLRTGRVPAVLVELGCMSHPVEERLLMTERHRLAMTAALARGLARLLAA